MIYIILRILAAGMLALFGLAMLAVHVLSGNTAAGIYWLILCGFGAVCFAPDDSQVDALREHVDGE